MALPIRDGNQSLTTLSTILVSNSHIPAHTVVSLGTQAITDIATAVSGVELGPNTLNALENITVTLGQVTITGGLTDAQLRASAVTIGGVVTATISGTPSVTFGTAVITGSTSVLNFPVTQPVSIASVTIGNSVTIGSLPNISGTVTVSNLPATQAVTFGQSTITGSVSILNLPATQTVTFTQAPVTFGTAVITGSTSIIGTASVTFTQASVTFGVSTITGSVSVLNIPATQAVTFTQASVTFSQPTITGSVSVLNFPASQSVTFTTATVTFGTAVITGSTSVLNFPATQTVTFSQAPVTFGLISGTVTANPTGTQTTAGTVTANLSLLASHGQTVTKANNQIQIIGGYAQGTPTNATVYPIGIDSTGDIRAKVAWVGLSGDQTLQTSVTYPLPVQILGGAVTIGSLPALVAGTAQIGSVTASISGTVPISISSVTVGNTVTIAGTVTANVGNAQFDEDGNLLVCLQSGSNPSTQSISGTVTVGNSVTIGSALPTGTNRIGVVTIGNIQRDGDGVQTSLLTELGSGYLLTRSTLATGTAQIGSVTASISNSLTISSLPAISGTVTANSTAQKYFSISAVTANRSIIGYSSSGGNQFTEWNGAVDAQVVISGSYWANGNPAPVSVANSVTIASLPALVDGTNRIGVVTIGGGTVTIGAGTAQIGSVTASVTNSVTVGAIVGPIGGSVFKGNSGSTDAIRALPYFSQNGGANYNELSTSNPFPIAGTVTLGASTAQIGSVTASISGTVPISISSVTVGNSVTIGSLPLIAGTVTASNVINGFDSYSSVTGNLVVGAGFDGAVRIVGLDSSGSPLNLEEGGGVPIISAGNNPIPISGTVTANVAGQYFDGASGDTAQLANPVYYDGEIFRVSPSHPLPVALATGYNFGASVTVGNSVTIASLPAISGTVTANTFALQGTAVTTSNFTSTTASTVLANFNATREVLTIFNEGAGNLFVSVGATCTTVQYQVRLSSGDYWEAPNHQSTITHSAVFATAGTARVTEVS